MCNPMSGSIPLDIRVQRRFRLACTFIQMPYLIWVFIGCTRQKICFLMLPLIFSCGYKKKFQYFSVENSDFLRLIILNVFREMMPKWSPSFEKMDLLLLIIAAAFLCCCVLLTFGCVCHLFRRRGFSVSIFLYIISIFLCSWRPLWLRRMHVPVVMGRWQVWSPLVRKHSMWRLITKYWSFCPFRWFKKGSCQFLAKECAQVLFFFLCFFFISSHPAWTKVWWF